jgi:hypothetical protein
MGARSRKKDVVVPRNEKAGKEVILAVAFALENTSIAVELGKRPRSKSTGRNPMHRVFIRPGS